MIAIRFKGPLAWLVNFLVSRGLVSIERPKGQLIAGDIIFS